MTWLLPSVISTLAGTALLSSIYLYLFLKDKKDYLGIWTLSWAVYLLRYIFMLWMIIGHETPILLIANQISTLLSGFILLWGTYRFIGHRFPYIFLYCSCAGIVWIISSILLKFSFLLMALPTFTFLAVVYCVTGLSFIRSSLVEGHEKDITGWAFILWGIHKADYPFLRPVTWIAPWGYLFGAILELVVAIGILLIYYQKIRVDLQKERYYLKKAQELGHIGTWELDLSNNKLYLTDENCRIFGVPEGSVIDFETFLDRVHPEDRKIFDLELKADAEGKAYDIEHRLLIGDNVKWVREKADINTDKTGKAISAIGFTQDITDQKASDNAMQAVVETIAGLVGQAFFDNIVDILCQWLRCEIALIGELDGVNIKALSMEIDGKRIYNYRYALQGTPCENLIHKDFCVYPKGVKNLFPNDRDLFELKAEGYVGLVLRDRKNQALGIVSVISRKKITIGEKEKQGLRIIAARAAAEIERKKAEDEKERLEEQLKQAQKMEGIGNLAGGIAHDFNNILSPIILHSEMAMDDLATDDPLQHDLKEIYKAAIRARDLVKQILTFARKTNEKRIVLRSSLIVKDVIKFLRSTIPTTIDIRYIDNTDCDRVFADPTQLNQIVMNLCTNAAHAMKEKGGILEVTLDNEEISNEIIGRFFGLKPGYYLRLSVKDNGMGIEDEDLDRIFEPYYTTKGPGEGTGLGLAIIHGIVKSYEGGINVESEPKHGTTFYVYLPVTDSEDHSIEEDTEEIPMGHERILFVDDEKASAEANFKMLKRLGYEVSPVTSSLEALKVFNSDPDAFDVVITDMTMPDMTGKDLAVELKKIRPSLPIILCTGFSDQINEELAKEIGISAFIMKPVIRKEIANLIRNVLKNR